MQALKSPRTVSQPDPAAVLAKATLRAASLMGFSAASLSKVIGLSEASISRISKGGRRIEPQSKEGELAALFVRMYRSLDALVGNDEKRRLAWIDSYNSAVNGTPRELVESAQGLVRVVSYLDGMRAAI